MLGQDELCDIALFLDRDHLDKLEISSRLFCCFVKGNGGVLPLRYFESPIDVKVGPRPWEHS